MELSIQVRHLPLRRDRAGEIRIGDTRVLLDTVVTAYAMGATAEEIAWQYPTLKLADVYSVLGYYLENKDEVDTYLDERRADAEKVRQQVESTIGSQQGLRARLLSRRLHQ